MLPEYSSQEREMNIEDRLKLAGLPTLKKGSRRGDLIQVFKIINGLDKLDFKHFFEFYRQNRTRGHKYKLNKVRNRLDIRKNFFSQRVINDWNNLPVDVVEARSLNSFKNQYDKHIHNRKNGKQNSL